ncbi:MAG: flavodoxin family protein [Candidatus Omnitrophica bacterium]|nr:flavodoxin family protein [Candidatus Omnitrophota bacterium]
MKTLIILGSRNPKGQTARAARAVFEGLASEGGKGEKVFLPQKKIELCRQCDINGWGICRTEGRCVIEDDFSLLVGKIRKADTVVFATPVYFSDLSESLCAFLDRLRRITRHESGKRGISDKPALGICVAGGGGRGAPACAVSLEKVLNICGFNVVDVIPISRQNLDVKLSALEAIGKWLTTCESPESKP